MRVTEFVKNTTGNMRSVVRTRQPLEIQYHSKDYVTVVPTDLWLTAMKAVAALDALGRFVGAQPSGLEPLVALDSQHEPNIPDTHRREAAA